MPLFLSAAASSLLPIPPLNLLPPPPPHHRRRFLPAPLAASSSSRPPPRRLYRRRRYAPTRPPTPAPAPPPQQRAANAASPSWGPRDARGQEELEAAIYDFMRRSAKPGAFPTREELVAAGRADLAAAVASSGGWLSLGWSSGEEGPAATRPSLGGGVHPDYPPETGVYDHALASDARGDAEREGEEELEEEEEEASPSGRELETEDTREVRFKAGLEGMLTRLQRDRERARPSLRRSNEAARRSDNGALAGNSSAPSHPVGGGRHTPTVPENGSIHGSHPQNGTLEGNNVLRSSSNDAWQTWTLGKGGLSDFEAAEVLPTESRKLSEHGELDIALVQDDIQRSPNGVAVSDYPGDGVDSERDEINLRLQSLELDLTSALNTLRSRFDKVLSDVSNGDGATVLDDISDDWEFEETKVMHAQEELRSIRAKIAVLEGKMALEIIERNKIIEEKQRRLDEVEKALSELRTVYIVWPNPASEVLVVGSFDGWTSQVWYNLAEFNEDEVQQSMLSYSWKDQSKDNFILFQQFQPMKTFFTLKRGDLCVCALIVKQIYLRFMYSVLPASTLRLERKMERSDRGIFSLNLRLYPGRYEIKFIVDGVWKNDPLRPTVYNNGHENNLLVVT
ncbi:hypothetical protein ACP70R_025201 [Stipagrostis hirtigluma subsp. patula]